MIGVEPDSSLLNLAAGRPDQTQVLHGSAEGIPLPEESVDVVPAGFAYFFPRPPSLAQSAVERIWAMRAWMRKLCRIRRLEWKLSTTCASSSG